MVSKNQLKFISSLLQKKNRQASQMFFAEGIKVVQELLKSNFELHHLYTTTDKDFEIQISKITIVSNGELQKMSALKTPNTCLAVFKIPDSRQYQDSGLILALDDIRDPGNLGTIIRLCDWFGIEQLICSHETVDLYNPKVVQATMGSISRVQVTYLDLEKQLLQTKLPIYGTFMNGDSIYNQQVSKDGIIVMGNEANGISKSIEKIVTNKLSIPRFGISNVTESLNVATATAIILSEFKRNSI